MLLVCVAGCSANPLTPITTTSGGACAHLGEFVSVGGTAGFNTLVNPDFTSVLRATGHVRIYEHATAISNAIIDSPPSDPYAILNAIDNVFSASDSGEAELGWLGANYFTLPAKNYPGFYQYQYVNSGLNPNAANVNVPYQPPSAIKYTKRNVRLWKEWAQAGKSAGITSMAPIVAPNAKWQRGNPIFPPTRHQYYNILSSFYELNRFEAMYGGGIAFDSPPRFFLTGGSGPGYQGFIEQAIQWGNANRIRTTVLISPYGGRATFARDTQTFVGILLAHHSIPTEWAVDNYENTDPNDARAMGPDTLPNTASGVALWLATHAPVYVNGAICRPDASP